MKPHLSDLELVQAIKTREQSGAEVLYDQYAATIFKIIYCKVHDPDAAEALLGATFLQLWNTINDYKEGRLIVWMTGIARDFSKKNPAPVFIINDVDQELIQVPSSTNFNLGV